MNKQPTDLKLNNGTIMPALGFGVVPGTQKGEQFKNPKKYVSRKSVADLIVKLATTPNFEIRKSLGVNKP